MCHLERKASSLLSWPEWELVMGSKHIRVAETKWMPERVTRPSISICAV
jgi:hypothetical protein